MFSMWPVWKWASPVKMRVARVSHAFHMRAFVKLPLSCTVYATHDKPTAYVKICLLHRHVHDKQSLRNFPNTQSVKDRREGFTCHVIVSLAVLVEFPLSYVFV